MLKYVGTPHLKRKIPHPTYWFISHIDANGSPGPPHTPIRPINLPRAPGIP